MFIKNFSSHLKYIFTEFMYLMKVFRFDRNLRLLTLSISIKFLIDSGFRNIIYRKTFNNQKNYFLKIMKNNLTLTNDWFSNNITTWDAIFKKHKLKNIQPKILEIGSYEGCSAVFFLNYFKNSEVTCIETFKGSDEHFKIDFAKIKKNFFNNTKKFQKRIDLYEGTSEHFFNSINTRKNYDLIYIDGSHHYDDVIQDAYNSFNVLDKNGIIIFDDFLKKYYQDLTKDPILAVLNFINQHKKDIKVINVGYQIIVKKNI